MQSGLTILRRIRFALEAAGDALLAGSAGALAGTESELEAAVAGLPALVREPIDPCDLPAFRDETAAVLVALRRCRRLGRGLTEFVRATLVAHGAAVNYGPGAQEMTSPRAGAFEAKG